MGLAEKLVNYRLENRVTQKNLAEMLSVELEEVIAMELEGRKPDATTLIKLAKLMNVPIDELMFDEDPEPGTQKGNIAADIVRQLDEVKTDAEPEEKAEVYDYRNNRVDFKGKVKLLNNDNKSFKDIDEVFLIQNPDYQGKNKPPYILTGFNHRKFLSAIEYEIAYFADLESGLKELSEMKDVEGEYTIKYGARVKHTVFGAKIIN